MRKIFIIILLFITSVFLYAKSNYSEIKTLEMIVNEKLYMNKKIKKSEYKIEFLKPNKIRKTIISPQLNKGEIYTYNQGKKKIYLPLFNQEKLENVMEDENEIIKIMDTLLKNIENDEKFRKDYENKKIKELQFSEGTIIKFNSFIQKLGYILPDKMDIYDKDTKIATITISNYEINKKMNEEDFNID